MAELIDKMQNIMCESCTSCAANWCYGEDKAECQWMQKIAEVGTTTEAEIRAKAYEKFAEAVILELECFAREMDGEPNSGFIDMCIDIVNTVVEQLKEE